MASAAMKERLRRCALARPSRRFRSSGSSRSVITLFSATNTLRIQKNTVYSSTARQPQVKRNGGTGKEPAACGKGEDLDPRHRGDLVHLIARFLFSACSTRSVVFARPAVPFHLWLPSRANTTLR